MHVVQSHSVPNARALNFRRQGIAHLGKCRLQSLQPGTRLAIASGLTLASASLQSRSVAAWKKAPTGPDAQTPAVFAIGA